MKWLELLREIAPHVTRVVFMYDPANPIWPRYLREIESAAPSLGMQVSAQAVNNTAEIERVLDAHASALNTGLIVLGSPENARVQVAFMSKAIACGIGQVGKTWQHIPAPGFVWILQASPCPI